MRNENTSVTEPLSVGDIVYVRTAGKVPFRGVFCEMTGLTSQEKSKVPDSLLPCYNLLSMSSHIDSSCM